MQKYTTFDGVFRTLTQAKVAKPIMVIIDDAEYYALQLENGQIIVPFGDWYEVYEQAEYNEKKRGAK